MVIRFHQFNPGVGTYFNWYCILAHNHKDNLSACEFSLNHWKPIYNSIVVHFQVLRQFFRNDFLYCLIFDDFFLLNLNCFLILLIIVDLNGFSIVNPIVLISAMLIKYLPFLICNSERYFFKFSSFASFSLFENPTKWINLPFLNFRFKNSSNNFIF